MWLFFFGTFNRVEKLKLYTLVLPNKITNMRMYRKMPLYRIKRVLIAIIVLLNTHNSIGQDNLYELNKKGYFKIEQYFGANVVKRTALQDEIIIKVDIADYFRFPSDSIQLYIKYDADIDRIKKLTTPNKNYKLRYKDSTVYLYDKQRDKSLKLEFYHRKQNSIDSVDWILNSFNPRYFNYQGKVNISILDKNHNGNFTDSIDILSINETKNKYFNSAPTIRSIHLKKRKNIINLYDSVTIECEVLNNEGVLKINQVNRTEDFDICLTNTVPKLIYRDTDSLLKHIILKGVTVVNLWTEYCVPCLENLPKFDSLQNNYSSKVNFISLFDGDSFSDLIRIKNQRNISHKLGMSNEKINAFFLKSQYPTYVVIKDGKVLNYNINFNQLLLFLEELDE